MAKRSDGIFSLRLVIADFHMEKPIQGFDPCYSEFRGKEIKRVPVIRVFGSNAQGQKCCMHVHGVFPYLYIPYDQKDFESANRAIYQIAMNIDKAINISLGQGSSQAQHVFKVQLVKGIPFYGYHRSEHQYLKIYMFNPRFIRRAANLLQNGAILNKNFHPHESHVPYILQFMIDYNLYGMSFLHVPLEIVKFRKSNPLDQIPFDGVDQAGQSLDCELAKKVSCSSLELDISSSFILNRFELALKNKKVNHTNPGIESIWNDEKLRRQKMAVEGEAAENKIPPLEIPASQERPNILPTDSEIFYRTGLVSKLLALAETSTVDNSQTINCTLQSNISNTTLLESINQSLTKQQHKRTFNLTKMLQNAVYPEECTQNSENLINASFVENHLSSSSGSAFQQSFMQEVNQILNPKLYDNENNRTWEADESVFMDDTIVDEQLVLSLTQQQCSAGSQHISSDISLRPEDIELLDILQQLEENNEDDKIDLDSSLAPLSQADKNFEQSPKLLDMETRTAAAHSAQIGSDSDSETDDNPHDFSIALDNLDDLILKLTQTQDKIKEEEEDDDNGLHPPQIDGADDSLQRTPTKSSVNNNALKTPPRTPTTPSRRRLTLHSPRTPKSAHKFSAIPMIVTNRSTGKTILDTTKLDNATPIRTGAAATGSLRKKVAVTELRRKTISLDRADFIKNDLFAENAENTTGSHKRRSKRLIDLDKTHVTCALTPRRTNEKMLKVYSIDEENNAAVKSLETKVTSDKILADKNPMTTKQIRNLNIKRKDEATASTISYDSCRPESHLDTDTHHGNFNKNVPADNGLDSESNTHKDSSKEQRSKTPNLKRLRRSFISKTIAKQRALTQKSQTIVSGEVINSSKFLQNSNELSNSAKEQSPPSSSSHTNVQQEKMSRIETKRIRVKLKRLSLKSNQKFKKDQYREAAEDSSTSNLNSNEHKLPKNNSLIESSTENTAAINHLDNNEKDAVELSLPPDDCTSHGNDELQKSTNFLENSVSSELLESLNTIIQQSYQQLVINSLAINDDAGDTSSIYDRTTSPLEDISCIQQHSSDDDEISATPPRNVPEYKTQRLSNLYDRTKSAKHSPALFLESSSPVFSSNAQLEHNSKSGSKESASSHITLLSSNNTDGGRENQVFSSATSGIGPADVLHLPSITTSDDVSTNGDGTILITPLDLPPSREEVLKGCIKFQLPEYEFQKPYYSNPDDITKQKEIGFTVLHIQGNKLNDVEEFQSVLGSDSKGINQWRKQKMMELGGPELLNRYRNPQRIREYLATSKSVCITPQMIAPTRQEAKLWLKARELLKNKDEQLFRDMKSQIAADEDSPIKIRRQKVTLMLNDGTEGAGNASGDSDYDETLNCSATHSLTLTPATPEIPKSLRSSQSSCTPVTTKIEKIPLEKLKIPRRNNRRVLRRISLNRKFQTILEQASPSSSQQQQQQQQSKIIEKSQEIKDSQESVIPNSQCSGNASSGSSSITSQQALNEMEKSSFMKNVKQSTKKNLLKQSFSLSDNTTLNNSFGFKVALENLQQAKSDVEYNYLTTIALEVFVCTRHDLFPNPEIDEIHCLFYAIENSIPTESHQQLPRSSCGYIMVSDIREKEGPIHGIDSDIQVTIVHTEIEALEALLGLCARWDPDIYAGYEIEMSSWGFVIERAKHLCLNIAPLLSRVPSQKSRDFVDEDREQFTDLDVDMKLCGRILLDVWRLMRSEIALTSYSFENVMYHIMHKRCPWHSYRSLTQWYSLPCTRWIVIEYYLERVRGTMALLDQLDLLGRTSEMAKLIGIQFYEVLSRGSQFRVESMMLRIGKPKNLVPLSPSVQQRAHMRAPEYLALILEPQSRFYEDPLIVLDFQSLYPSMIIAYNYCFSTCLGRVEHLGQSTPFEFGASQLRVSPAMLRKLIDRDLVTISPCGVVFVKSTVREGILPRMLTEILDTRQMVKQSMKLHKSNSALQRILHSRQLGLKLMANVTYGYTAANFSGRMPCVEVGDSVVAKGRETLERAIKLVETNEKWNVKVVYGDTDSLFVLVPGRDRAEAFRIGEEIVEAVTKQNPLPVKLKLEKVYQPCILQTKKRYVGYMYETPDQKEPVYEAKGIETVRRDGCPIVAKMLEKVLRILFETADVSQVKQYVCRQFTKLLSGKANIQDLIFAKEFRGLNGYKANACVPALELTRKWIQTDPRRIPRRGERVPFIITNGPPGLPLIRLIKHPHEVLAHEGLKINAVYYITKAIIPPLNRCLYLIGADVNEWFANLPRKILLTPALSLANEVITSHPLNKFKKSTISQFFSTTNCVLDCGRQTKDGICSECNSLPSRCMIILQSKISKLERCYLSAQQICQACCGRVGDLECASLDCPVLYVLEVKHRDLKQIAHYRNLLDERF